MKRMISTFLVFFLGITLISCSNNTQMKEITISVAASLEDPIREVISRYETENKDIKINVNLGSSRTLRKQIEEGAKIDLFLSASKEESNSVVESEIVSLDKVRDILSNGLILVKSNNSNKNITCINDLIKLDGKLAIGAEGVPIGNYAIEVLKNLEIYDEIQEKIVFCKDAKSVLNYVKLGEVDYSIVYSNEINNLGDAKIIEWINSDMHSPIIYTLSMINSNNEDVNKFQNYIEENIDIFEEYGFERK